MVKLEEIFKNKYNILSFMKTKAFNQILIKLAWVAMGVLTLFCLLSFAYGDMFATTAHSLKLLDEVFSGNFFGFYESTLSPIGVNWVCPAVYEMPVYLLLALWNLPIYIALGGGGDQYLSSPVAIVYSHLIYVIFLIGVGYYLKKILDERYPQKIFGISGAFLFFSSISVVMSVFFIGQVESISLFFMMQGVYYYLRGNRKIFVVAFAFAIVFKMFAIFLFIPLILLGEKKIYRIILNLLGGTSILVFFKLLFANNEGYQVCQSSLGETILSRLNYNSIPVTYSKASVFMMIFVMICVYAYYQKIPKHLEGQFITWLGFTVFVIFFVFTNTNPYWIILLVPFQILVMYANLKYLKLNMLLEISGTISAMLIFINGAPQCYSANLTNRTYFHYLSNWIESSERKYPSLRELFLVVKFDKYMPWIQAVFVGVMVSAVVLNYPLYRNKSLKSAAITKLAEIKGLIFSRFLITCLIVISICYCATVRKPINILNNINEEQILTIVPYTGEAIKQYIYFDEKKVLDKMELIFTVPDSVFTNSESIQVEFENISEGEVLYRQRKAVNLIKSWAPTVYNMEKIEVKPGVQYSISIYLLNGRMNNVAVVTAPDEKHLAEMKLYSGNELLKQNLQLIINGHDNK